VFVLHQADKATLVTGQTLDSWVALEEDSMAWVADHERGDDTDIHSVPEAAYRKAMGSQLNLVGCVEECWRDGAIL
jgi:hypothetical protein